MLYSVGKDSSVMLHIAKKAFYPSPPPFPLLHVDTTWKFREMYELRDSAAKDAGMELIIHQNPEAIERGINPFEHGALHTDMWKTAGLKQALDKFEFDAASGALMKRNRGEREGFHRDAQQLNLKHNGQELWSLFNLGRINTRACAYFHFRIGPNWTFGSTFTARA